MHFRSVIVVSSLILPPLVVLGAAGPSRGLAGHNSDLNGGRPNHRSRNKSANVTSGDSYAQYVAPLVHKYCVMCHGGGSPTAGLSLAAYRDVASVIKAHDVWSKVAENVGSGHMPPGGAPHPTPAERDRLVSWIQSTLSKADCQIQDPGRVTLHRLNREEYNNTVRDLLGVDLRPADEFPSDDVGYGFDNIGDVLSISPLLMEKYVMAAEKVARAAIVLPDADSRTERFQGPGLAVAGGASYGTHGARILTSEGELSVDVTLPREGTYVLRARAFGQQAGPEKARMAFRLDGKEAHAFQVAAEEANPQSYETRILTQAGKHRFAAAFTNDYYNPNDPDPKNRDRNLVIESLEVVGPLGMPAVLPASHRRRLPSTPAPEARDAFVRKRLGDLARKAFRRPVTADEVERLVGIVDRTMKTGAPFERGVQLAVEAILVSPNFLFRVEIDPHPNDPKATRMVGDYELASRLSYFLWSTMPDEDLFTLAAKGVLHKSQVIAVQVRRMLKDPKAHALCENFADQWLTLRNLNNVAPNPDQFPDFNDDLRRAMRTETEMFFDAIVKEDRSILDFIDARFTFLNGALARHYGIAGVTGDAFRRVGLTGDQRGGVLTQASVLTVTSNPTRTSPVKRGKWVLEQLLGTPPPPPPPGAGILKDDNAKGALTGTLRQRMEQHRKNPACAACHARMDPLGFGLENYDAVGAWRTREGKFAVDSSGVLPGGQSFRGPAQLKAILKSKKAQFTRCLAEKMLTYALGRGLESYDRCTLNTIATTVAAHDYRFSSLVTSVVQSDPFRKRRGDGGTR